MVLALAGRGNDSNGPVRGNGKIIQELERVFRGADWNVLKVIWGSGWDGLLARDKNGVLRKRMDECLDGDYQMYSVLPGDVQREHWVEGNPELEQMMSTLTDAEVKEIKRGGQDRKKIFAAFSQAMENRDKPTVLLVKTVKGDGMGAQGKNTAHQYKNMSPDERVHLAKELGIPLPDEAAAAETDMGELIASGWHVCSMQMRMIYDGILYKTASMGSFGLEEIKWLAPVRPGDVLSVKRTTLDKRVSKSRPEMGIINFRWEIYDQKGELKSTTVGPNLVQTRSSLETA